MSKNAQILAFSLIGLLTWINLIYAWILIFGVQFYDVEFSMIYFLLGPHYVVVRLSMYAYLYFAMLTNRVIDAPVWPKRMYKLLVAYEIVLFLLAFFALLYLWVEASVVGFDYLVVYGLIFFRFIHVASTIGYGVYFNYSMKDRDDFDL